MPFPFAPPCWQLHGLWRIKVSCDGTRLFPPPCGHNPEPGDERGTMSSLTTTQPAKGLEGVVATTSSICYIDGEQGVLAYRGIDIHELADNANFEETCNLLWFGKLPTRNELKDLRERLARERHLDPANFLLLLNGERPSGTAERALDIALILHADHELNASTFAARVTAATLSDMHSAITSAIGALKGPLHGGANEAVFLMLQDIDK